jgi:transcriptional antiterminator RfaH
MWAVAQTMPQQEQLAREHLQRAGFSDDAIYIPRVKETYFRKGRPASRIVPMFRSYLFLASETGAWWSARWCIGITRLLMAAEDKVARVPDALITELRTREKNGLVVLPQKRPEFMRGDQIQVTGGLFQGKLGLFDGMRPHERVLVLLDWLGSERRVQLAKADIRQM